MFSFFRKDKPEDLMAFLKESLPEFGPGPTYNQTKQPAANLDGGIEVMEAAGGLPPELEEAAVLYANGKVGETAALLNRYLLDQPDNRDPLPWYMLFDLYEASDQAAPFEDAAVDFAVKFERSPPTWTPRGKPKAKTQAAPVMVYGEKYGSLEKVKQPRFFQDARNAAYVRLDFSKTQSPDEETARALLDDIVRLNEMKKPVELQGGPGFAVRLDAARQGGRLTESGWFLLLAVLQLLGKEEDFDKVALDYAMTFEVSPPSYVPPQPLPSRAVDAPAQAPVAPGLSYALSGTLSPGSEAQLQGLRTFAKGKPQVEVDLSQLTRIDFAVVGLLLETLIEVTQSGCKILFKEGNELVNTLLQIVGAGQFAMILGRTRV
ncbi:MAG: STAS domain-containing protein [Pseudomonadota bacterium]